jgi:amidase
MQHLDYLGRLDGMAQAELVARGELRGAELLEACERRLTLVNPLIRAVVSHDFEAARARVERGVSGPFAYVPFLFKDLNAYPGLRVSFGSRLFAHNVAQQGSPFSERVDAGGLVTVGKSACSEFGLLGSTETLLDGITHNPWRLSASALGSSGGAAAAVAAGIVPLAHASDGGGSIRIPASAAGLFGLKPSRGRTVAANLTSSPFDFLISEGCISRSVRDSASFLSLVEAQGAGSLPPLGYVRGPSTRRLRIGCMTRSLIGSEPEPEVLRSLESTAALCRELGHELVPSASPRIDGAALSRAFFTLAGATLAGMVDTLTPAFGRAIGAEDLEPFTRSSIDAARASGPDGLAQAQAEFELATHRYAEAVAAFDVVLTPTLALPPWELGWLSPTLDRRELIARTERAVCYTPIQTIAGHTAMSVPLHWSAAGLPLGSHFSAPSGGESVLLALAYELEAARPWAERWAPYSFAQLAAA